MTILALEFSSPLRSVAVARDGAVLGEATETGGRNTAAFAMIDRALAQAGIEREAIELIAVGLGPGSYTGIRSAVAIAQGWQLARSVKTIGIGSVQAIAAQAQAQGLVGRVNVVIDAQRNEFYRAAYDLSPEAIREVQPLKIVPASEIESLAPKETVIGPDAGRWSGRVVPPAAAMVARLAAVSKNYLPADQLEPIYLRETAFVKAPASAILSRSR
ncbi:MAG TPA: tRNA (adenosine(37)-N6)-threonylcarbamoyltransferase complex dimerization subunit type 1 TsaB [Verrucomicrobiae bacterium]|nr:tRNA (adenosine(37)-N6)-threonylcarbamoyltransferase complex dimerization subunit type 1 TsaB [Verrucomicrobiae bacterium]